MPTKRLPELTTPSGLQRLVGHAFMGVAAGLVFGLVLVLINPSGTATLIEHGGDQATVVIMSALVLTFGIGAALTGAVFILAEDE